MGQALINSERAFLVTPRFMAAFVTVKPRGFNTSSFKIMPGQGNRIKNKKQQ
jgi:hypothetical protein